MEEDNNWKIRERMEMRSRKGEKNNCLVQNETNVTEKKCKLGEYTERIRMVRERKEGEKKEIM